MEQKYSVTAEAVGITFSTGEIAKQANGSVTLSLGETTVIVNATVASKLREGQDFFPLTVDYREKFAAAGRFPGGYFKREGKPSEKEILTSRLCDRPLRPLFPKGFMNEVQVIGYLLSTDLKNEPDTLMVNGASAAMMLSDIPWNGPVGCVRIGEIDGEFLINPTNEQIGKSKLDLLYVGNEKEMMMIEGSADQIPEDRFFAALEFAHKSIQPIIQAQKELAEKAGKPKLQFDLVKPDPKVLEICQKVADPKIGKALFESDKRSDRDKAVSLIIEEAKEAARQQLGEGAYKEDDIALSFEEIQEEAYRKNILTLGKRVDGRAPADLRTISCKTSVLPRVHGTALFQRGETQTIAMATLGNARDAQDLDGLTGGVEKKSFILHYNFPPFSVGETGRFGFTGRREIGHGALAERSLLPVLPSLDDFPYAIRVVSEIMESNGSTSMASICGGSLALMDAGVPISDPVAGISCGLVSVQKEDGKIDTEKSVLLTDILGAEDHFGDMDFKIAGTKSGITGFQLDLKIQGISFDLAKKAIDQATDARKKILDTMIEHLPAYRSELNSNAPRIHSIQIDPEKIGALIGPGGKNIRRIVEVSGADIDISDDDSGKVNIYAADAEALDRAFKEISLITAEIEPGKIYRSIVKSIKDFGVFVECLPGKEGLVHISELADFRVNRTSDVCKEGEEMIVKCLEIDDRGRVRLSRKAAMKDIEAKKKEAKKPEESEETTAV